MHIGYSFRKPSWPKGTEIIIETTDFYEACMECYYTLIENFAIPISSSIDKQYEEVVEKYIIEKIYK